MIRLDKLLGHSGYGTRKEIKSLCKNGDVTVNGEIVRDSSVKVYEGATVIVAGEKVEYEEVSYLMLHKPAGVVSATQDSRVRTVLDILPSRYAASRVAPVGRLDIDTTGLLLLSNDGTWAHKVISPKKHVPKVYEAQVEGVIPDDVGERFAAGIVLEDGLECLPARAEKIAEGRLQITVCEGKFHQVKRMCSAVGLVVTALHRSRIGGLILDKNLKAGEYRKLTREEIDLPLLSTGDL